MEFIKLNLQDKMMMMKLLPLYQNYEAEISKATIDEIFPSDELKENNAYFEEYFGRGITTYIYMIDADFKGFVSFHIDSKEVPGYAEGYNGWGHLAEIYIKKEMRGLGLGKKMVKKAEEELAKLNVKNIYLTDLSGNDYFGQSLGYTDTNKIESKEGGRIYEKNT